MRFAFCALVALALSSSCASTQSTGPASSQASSQAHSATRSAIDPAKIEALSFSEANDNFSFVDGVTGAQLTYAEVQERALLNDAILIGEQHDQSSHHRLQARVIKSLSKVQRLAVGFEMVDWRHQADLKRLEKNEIDLDGFFAVVGWEKNWGRQSPVYRAVFNAALEASAQLVALNCPRSVVRRVSRHGFDSLSDEVKARLPELNLDDPAHRDRIQAIFSQHGDANSKAFMNFYTAQVIWDELMAEGAAKALDQGSEKVVVIAGAGHLATEHAVKGRILRRKPEAKVFSIIPITVEADGDVRKVVADAINEGAGNVLAVRRARALIDL